MNRRNTRQRETILAVLQTAEGPLGISDIHIRAKHNLESLGLATVYRAVRRMCDEKDILEVALPGEEARYEVLRAHHHHHFRCQNCQKVFELDFCPLHLPSGTLLPNGYRVFEHHLTFYGLCQSCDSRAT
jgi:Fur family transcriptional regulator, ferric uptake regulator